MTHASPSYHYFSAKPPPKPQIFHQNRRFSGIFTPKLPNLREEYRETRNFLSVVIRSYTPLIRSYTGFMRSYA
jgi:hypothetical protein